MTVHPFVSSKRMIVLEQFLMLLSGFCLILKQEFGPEGLEFFFFYIYIYDKYLILVI